MTEEAKCDLLNTDEIRKIFVATEKRLGKVDKSFDNDTLYQGTELKKITELFENARNHLGSACFHDREKCLDRVKELIAEGFDFDVRYIPYHSIEYKHVKPLSIIHYMWENENDADVLFPVSTRIRIKYSKDILKVLIDAGVNVNAQKHPYDISDSILSIAVENGAPIEIIKMLLDAGATFTPFCQEDIFNVKVTPLEFLQRCFIHEGQKYDNHIHDLGVWLNGKDGFYSKETGDLIIKHLKL